MASNRRLSELQAKLREVGAIALSYDLTDYEREFVREALEGWEPIEDDFQVKTRGHEERDVRYLLLNPEDDS